MLPSKAWEDMRMNCHELPSWVVSLGLPSLESQVWVDLRNSGDPLQWISSQSEPEMGFSWCSLNESQAWVSLGIVPLGFTFGGQSMSSFHLGHKPGSHTWVSLKWGSLCLLSWGSSLDRPEVPLWSSSYWISSLGRPEGLPLSSSTVTQA